MLHIIYLVHSTTQCLDKYVSTLETQLPEISDTELQQLVHDIYQNLFLGSGAINTAYVTSRLHPAGRLRLKDVLSVPDVDHYTLLDKAVIYNSPELTKFLLNSDDKRKSLRTLNDLSDSSSSPLHLAAAGDVVDLLVQHLSPCVLFSNERVMINNAMGPARGNLLVAGGHQLSGIRPSRQAGAGEAVSPAWRRRWLREHAEVPAVCAVVGDHDDVMEKLIVLSKEANRNGAEVDIIHRLVTVASLCASYKCLRRLLVYCNGHLPEHLLLPALSSGFRHGSEFFTFLVRGLLEAADDKLNSIHQSSGVSTNALHIYYCSIGKEDQLQSKFQHVYTTTRWLLEHGIDVNAVTSPWAGRGLAETPLHRLIDLINLPIKPCDDTQHPTPGMQQLQHHFDKCVYHSIKLILQSDFDIRKHCSSLLLRLLTNCHHIQRFRMRRRFSYLRSRAYGMENLFSCAKLLLEFGSPVVSAKRQYTPLIATIDWLVTEDGFQCVFGDQGCFDTFHFILSLLRRSGTNPNHYPLLPNHDSVSSPPLIHLLDLIGHRLSTDVGGMTDEAIQNVQRILVTFMNYGANCQCTFIHVGKYLSHGVFDFLIPVFRAVIRESSVLKLTRTLKQVFPLIHCLLDHGAAPKVFTYAQHKSVLYGPVNVRHQLFYQTLMLASYVLTRGELDELEENGGSTFEDELYNVLSVLYLHTPQNLVRGSIKSLMMFSMLEDSDSEECDRFRRLKKQLDIWSQEIKSLQDLAKLTVRRCLGRKLPRSVDKLPVPDQIKKYILLYH